MNAAEFERALTRWCSDQPDVVATAIVGSRARGEAGPDSDIDVVLITTEKPRRLEDREWLHDFGAVTAVETEDWGVITSLRTHYADGREVEFGLGTPDWAKLPVDAGTAQVLRDGVRVLYDPTGLCSRAVADARG